MQRGLRGLSQKEALEKLKEYGYNEIKEILHISPLKILLRQIKKNFIVYLLFVAMLISFFVGKDITGYAILAVIAIIVSVGFIQEYRAEKAILALKSMLMPVSIVIRDGKQQEISSRELVPDDIVVLRIGERIPADCVVIEEKELRVDESILTGESKEIRKLATKNLKDYKKENILFMGTFVINGKCIAKVIHTGMNTEFGKIAGMISTAEKELPLQKKVNAIAKYMTTVAIIFSVLTGLIMSIRNLPLSFSLVIEILIVIIALSVSAFPEGFPVVLISTLARGAYRMAKKNAIVNRMSIIETLGETTIVCADKTGTITKGEMTAKYVFCDDKMFEISGTGYSAEGKFFYNKKEINIKNYSVLNLLIKTAVLCNDSVIERKGTDKDYNIIGTPTEGALLIMASKAEIFKEDLRCVRKAEIPFTSERKMMSVLCSEEYSDGKGKDNFVYSKGATEILIEKCKFIRKNDKTIKLTEKEKKKILSINKKFTSRRLRVLALAYKKIEYFYKKDLKDFEKNLVFLGLVALEDPPREEVASAIKLCKKAGIKVKMITGDDKETALQIAKEIGLEGDVITANELNKLTDEELSKIIDKIAIFARVNPSHKLRIVKALKQNKEIVAMTGDGVNDAPALKEAHIGIAMGKRGADVTREVADLTLKDDNFATIVSAIIEGRTIFNNIRKFITYQLSCNYAELFIIFFGILMGLPLPLLALQILFMNLVTDDLPAITLGFNPPSLDIMEQPPRKRSNIINKRLIFILMVAGTIVGIITLGIFYLMFGILKKDLTTSRTVALITIIFFEIANAFNFRSFRSPTYKLPLFANKYLVYASFGSILATLLIIYTPLNKIFETGPIAPHYFIFVALLSIIIIIAFDIWKKMKGNLLIEEH